MRDIRLDLHKLHHDTGLAGHRRQVPQCVRKLLIVLGESDAEDSGTHEFANEQDVHVFEEALEIHVVQVDESKVETKPPSVLTQQVRADIKVQIWPVPLTRQRHIQLRQCFVNNCLLIVFVPLRHVNAWRRPFSTVNAGRVGIHLGAIHEERMAVLLQAIVLSMPAVKDEVVLRFVDVVVVVVLWEAHHIC